MTDAWPVASGVALAASALALMPLVAAAGVPAIIIVAMLALAVYAGWAHAIAKAAHGQRGGLLALGAAAIVAGILAPAWHLGLRAPFTILSALAAFLALGILVPEWRRRRGPAGWGSGVGMAALCVAFAGALGLV